MKTRIKELRKSFSLSQAAFGKKLGVSRDVINNIEQGRNKNNMSDIFIGHICNTFNVNETWLRTGEGEMFVKNTTQDNYELSPHAALILQNFRELSKSEQDEFIKLSEKIIKEDNENTNKKENNIKTFQMAADSGATENILFHTDEEN